MINIRDGNLPEGKGTFLWLLPRLVDQFNGMGGLIKQLVDDGYQWVTVKAQHGYVLGTGYDDNQVELLDTFVPAAEEAGIEVHGWGFNYGNTTTWRKWNNQEDKETARIVEAMVRWRFRSWFLNAEYTFKVSGGNTAAVNLINMVREALETHPEEIDVPVGLSSYKFPSSHPEFPWLGFLQNCDFSSPQVYWQLSNYPVDQLEKAVSQWNGIRELPIVAAGTTYPEGDWWPSGDQVTAFNERAKEMPEVIGTCYWEHYYPFRYGKFDILDALSDFVWAVDEPEPEPEDPTLAARLKIAEELIESVRLELES